MWGSLRIPGLQCECKFLAGWGLRAPGLSDQQQRALAQPSSAPLCPDSGHPTQWAMLSSFTFVSLKTASAKGCGLEVASKLTRIFATLWEQPLQSDKFWVKILRSAIHQLYNLGGWISARDSHNYSMIPL